MSKTMITNVQQKVIIQHKINTFRKAESLSVKTTNIFTNQHASLPLRKHP